MLQICYRHNTLLINLCTHGCSSSSIGRAFDSLRTERDVELTCSPRDLINYLKSNYDFVRAAGGVVEDCGGKKLIINRLNEWDLPKGKLEVGETIAQNAIREVMEETGLKNVVIESLLLKTYHIHNRYGRWTLKQTTWFSMRTPEVCPSLTPQTEEEIVAAEWIDSQTWHDRLMLSYATMRQIANQTTR